MSLTEQLRVSGFSFNKSLGQNFIFDEGFLDSLVEVLGLSSGDVVVEVGTGVGTFTRCLAKVVKKVVTIEIDRRLEKVLERQFADFKNIELIFGDALKMSNGEIFKLTGGTFKVVANIPYYITTPLIMKFVNCDGCCEINVLVQDDVAKRIVANPGGKEYGALSVTMQAFCDCKIVKKVASGLFVPSPNVDSAFVQCKILESVKVKDKKVFERLLKGMFAARRKTVLNSLSIAFGIDKKVSYELLFAVCIDETLRAENISVEKFIELSNLISDKKI